MNDRDYPGAVSLKNHETLACAWMGCDGLTCISLSDGGLDRRSLWANRG